MNLWAEAAPGVHQEQPRQKKGSVFPFTTTPVVGARRRDGGPSPVLGWLVPGRLDGLGPRPLLDLSPDPQSPSSVCSPNSFTVALPSSIASSRLFTLWFSGIVFASKYALVFFLRDVWGYPHSPAIHFNSPQSPLYWTNRSPLGLCFFLQNSASHPNLPARIPNGFLICVISCFFSYEFTCFHFQLLLILHSDWGHRPVWRRRGCGRGPFLYYGVFGLVQFGLEWYPGPQSKPEGSLFFVTSFGL